MSIEKLREEFEAWLLVAWPKALTLKFEDGQYRMGSVQEWWIVWQASRAAMVIELPDDGIEDCRNEWPERGEKYRYDTFDTGYLYACKKHEEAIEAAGVKVRT